MGHCWIDLVRGWLLHSDRERVLTALIKGPADPQDVGGGKGRCQAPKVLATSCMSGVQSQAPAAARQEAAVGVDVAGHPLGPDSPRR